MSTATLNLTPELARYLRDISLRESEPLRQLREETGRMPNAVMQIAPEQGQFMALLVRLINARRIIEVGVFTGYSSICMAAAMPPAGKLVACDVSEDYTRIAREYWQRTGVADRIELRLAPATETLKSLLAAGEAGRYDLAFIDADKENYDVYYELCLELLRPGGLILVDNVLWGGSVIDPSNRTLDTEAIRAFNLARHGDDRVEISLLPVADGLTLLRKR